MKKILIIILTIICHGQTIAQDAVIFTKNSEIDLNPYLYYYLDSTGQLEIEDIRDHSHEFKQIGENDMRLGVDETVVWLRLRIHNPYDRKEDAVIDFKDPSLYSLTLFQINNDQLYSGTGTPQEKKNIRGNRNAFILSLSSGETRDLLMRIDSKNYMTIKATVEDDEYFFQNVGNEKVFIGFYYGILTLILIYSLILFIISRMNYFFWYVLYISINMLFTGTADGLMPQFLYFIVAGLNGYHELLLVIVSNTIGLIFLKSYFRPQEWAPRLNKAIIAVIWAILLMTALFYFFETDSGFAAMRLVGIITLGLYLGTGVYAMKNGITGSRIFLLAFSFLGLFIVIFILNLFRIIPYGHFVQYSLHYGFLLSNVVLSGAMGVRIYQLYQSYIREEQDKQMIIRQKNEELENQVQERTADLMTKESLLRSILDNSTRSIWLLDKDLILREFNQAFKSTWMEYFGVELKEGMKLQATYSDKDYQSIWKSRYTKIFSGEIISTSDVYEVNGKESTYEVIGVPIKNNDTVEFAAMFATDITDRIISEEQLKSQNQNLRKVNEELDRFVYSASHDLKAPLSSLQGLISLLKIETDHELRDDYYEMMEKSIQRLDQFIRDIIDYSRNTRVELRNNKINVEELIHSVYEDLHYMVHAPEFKTSVSVNQPEAFFSDETRLRIIIRNLLSNALRYGYGKGSPKKIDVTGKVDSTGLTIHIRDYGPGIAMEHHDNIFKMFYRANESSDGTGLGLYIVKETIEKMGGSVQMDTSDKGTRFSLFIPNAEE